MSEKRRDSKKRILRNGESHRTDGRYAYTYVDYDGKQKFLYSWKLEPTDKLPAGKRECVALREQVKQLERDLMNGVKNHSTITVAELCEIYFNQKNNLRYNSKRSLKESIDRIKQTFISQLKVCDVKPTVGKNFIIDLYNKGYGYRTLVAVKTVIKSVFNIALEEQIIHTNPFNFNINQIIKNDTEKKKAITKQEEISFLEFLQSSNVYSKYYDMVYLLLHTGLRVSEFCGLMVEDIDFTTKTISVNKQLLKKRELGKGELSLEKPKTKSGERVIPFTEKTEKILQGIVAGSRNKPHVVIKGTEYQLLFSHRSGTPYIGNEVSALFKRMANKYEQTHCGNTITITPHICRHTFCSRLAEKRINPKALQYIMGHNNIQTTLNIYTHITLEGVCKEFYDIMNE